MRGGAGTGSRGGSLAAACVALAGIMPASCSRTPPTTAETTDEPGDPWFEEVWAATGLDFVHTTGHDGRFWFPEISAGGVGLLDYDGDGYLDLYLVQAGTLDPSAGHPPGNKLYRNLGNWTFEDVTEAAGVGDTGYGSGCTCGDYDGDGDTDLYVTNLGPNVLYRNNGDGTFTDVTGAAGVGDASWGTSCAFVDYDQDGNVDLIIANYVAWSRAAELNCFAQSGERDYCAPKNYNAPSRDTLYRNLGDGTFRDVTVAAGMDQAFGNGFGVACADYNLDGHLDFYVANDGMANRLWIAAGDGTFTDEGLMLGCALNRYGWPEAGMGVAAVDIENDGDPDLFMSHIGKETNTFYINHNGSFEDATAKVGLAAPSQGFTGFGLGFADFDHDGHLDLYVANGRVRIAKPQHRDDDPFAEPNHLFRSGGGMRFEEVIPRGGTAELRVETSRAAAFGDLDNDGDIDLVVVNKDAKPYLLRNVVGSRGNWVMFRVRDRRGHDAAGSWVGVDAGGRRQWHPVQRAYSFCASNDPRTHVGLGAATRVDGVQVRWPDGRTEAFGPFAAGAVHELREGAGLR
ncbi:MAG: CRTAC1 family protein [Planctomycetota bacterium]